MTHSPLMKNVLLTAITFLLNFFSVRAIFESFSVSCLLMKGLDISEPIRLSDSVSDANEGSSSITDNFPTSLGDDRSPGDVISRPKIPPSLDQQL